MISNAKKIAAHMSSETAMKAHYPAMYRIMKMELAHRETLAYWPLVTCPVVFISSSNDFHSTFERIYRSMALLKHQDWRVTTNIHQNHGPGPEQWAVLNLWFNQYLKGLEQDVPVTPPSSLSVAGKTASFAVTPANQERLVATEIYSSYDPNSRTRFWQRAQATRSGTRWMVDLKVHDELPLYVFAICRYRLPRKMSLERGETSTFTLNSIEKMIVPETVNLQALAALEKTTTVFEDFKNGIQDWSSRDQRSIRTYKFQSPDLDCTNDKLLALTVDPEGRRLSLRMNAESKFLSRENNLGSFSSVKRVEGKGARVIRIDREEFEGLDGKTLEWSKIASFDVSIVDEATQAKLDLTSAEGHKVLQLIQLVESDSK